MNSHEIGVFIDNLNLKLNIYSFEFVAAVPLSFRVLGNVNRVSDRAVRNLNLPDDLIGKPLKEILQAPDDLEDEKVTEAIQHLNDFLKKENLEKLQDVLRHSRDEEELEIGLGVHLISKLHVAGTAFTSTKKSTRSCPCGCLKQLQNNEKMYIGSEKTWYGELDIIAGNPATGSSVLVTFDKGYGGGDTGMQGKNEEVKEEFESDDDKDGAQGEEHERESPAERTNVEIKYSGLVQLISEAIVFGFTEYNRHKTMGKCIPSVLVGRFGYQYVIYNPVDDILLVSNYMSYFHQDNFDRSTGYRPFVVLWIILNHRIFFSLNADFRRRCVKSGFHEKIGDLLQYKNLAEYSKNIEEAQPMKFPDDTPNTITTDALYWFGDRFGDQA